ncbi:hypothetical protein DSO57_1014402 [Entomophthora muscae]|uniref:Uncharacterized protein n=1 Tax=Entomophthora muscae TaxID=34485 RepID=A0ACC2UF81_9FUNG|nr:hypothetical protein DSO57_1014402 [Entomophthora muscae]
MGSIGSTLKVPVYHLAESLAPPTAQQVCPFLWETIPQDGEIKVAASPLKILDGRAIGIFSSSFQM